MRGVEAGATIADIEATMATEQLLPLNPANRRIRTRTYGGVGGEELRGSPLSRFQCLLRSALRTQLGHRARSEKCLKAIRLLASNERGRQMRRPSVTSRAAQSPVRRASSQ